MTRVAFEKTRLCNENEVETSLRVTRRLAAAAATQACPYDGVDVKTPISRSCLRSREAACELFLQCAWSSLYRDAHNVQSSDFPRAFL